MVMDNDKDIHCGEQISRQTTRESSACVLRTSGMVTIVTVALGECDNGDLVGWGGSGKT